MFMPSGVAAAAGAVIGTDEYALIAASNAPTLSVGYVRNSFGSIDPEDTPFLPYGKALVQSVETKGGQLVFTAVGINAPNDDSTFSNITLTGEFNDGGTPLGKNRSEMTYTADDGNGNTRWQAGIFSRAMLNGNSYTVNLT